MYLSLAGISWTCMSNIFISVCVCVCRCVNECFSGCTLQDLTCIQTGRECFFFLTLFENVA